MKQIKTKFMCSSILLKVKMSDKFDIIDANFFFNSKVDLTPAYTAAMFPAHATADRFCHGGQA
jgi:hypothetical protein